MDPTLKKTMACTGSIKLECACAALNNFFRFFSFLKLSGRSPLKNAKGTSILKADYRKVRGDEQFLVVIELLARQIVVVVMYYLGSNSEMNVSSTFRSVEATTAALASESSTGSLNVRYKVIFLMEVFDYKRK